jgi:glycosyltransferase involved in cell wall biosynthesis
MSGVLVHEWLQSNGGSENVFDALSEAFPDAARVCMWNDSGGRFTDIDETVLARTPLRRSKLAALPFMPFVWRNLPARDADWILCSSHVFAHHARFAGPARDVPKLVYAHTPARYVWAPQFDDRGAGLTARAASAILKPLDRARAGEATAIAANSRFVAARIADAWGREADVVYPPVDVDTFMSAPPVLDAADQAVLDSLPADFLLGVSRFVPYKRMEAVIDAGIAANAPVVLAGAGPDEARLRELAREHPGAVSFVARPSQPLLRVLYRRARALVFAAIEDFGIVPVEAMASGTPVIANAVGGASESVLDGTTGALVHTWSRDELRAALDRADRVQAADCVDRAIEFDTQVFIDRMRGWVTTHVDRASMPDLAELQGELRAWRTRAAG